MTFEEARAQFPVLERFAYLQAGSVGPLARATIEAMRDRGGARASRRERERRAFERDPRAARGASRRARRRSSDVDVEHVALTASTTDGCNIVLAGLDLGPDDEVVTTTDEHFGLLGPLHASGARVVVARPNRSGSWRR